VVLTLAYAINDSGQILAWGYKPAGGYRALLLTPVTVPLLMAPSINSRGVFLLTLVGDAGRSYTIQASTDLLSWTVLTNFVSATGTNQFTDVTARNFNRRSYRAVSP